jgi:hypothetical protein
MSYERLAAHGGVARRWCGSPHGAPPALPCAASLPHLPHTNSKSALGLRYGDCGILLRHRLAGQLQLGVRAFKRNLIGMGVDIEQCVARLDRLIFRNMQLDYRSRYQRGDIGAMGVDIRILGGGVKPALIPIPVAEESGNRDDRKGDQPFGCL